MGVIMGVEILSAKPNKIIIAELKNKQSCENYKNCISGTFQYQNNANAILIYGDNQINNLSAHGWLNYPDSCLIYYKNGTFAIKRLVSIPNDELPNVQWAISGVGMLDMYDPKSEGYCKFTKNGKTYDYSDVLRKTNHTAIGIKDGLVYGFYLPNMTGADVNNYLKSYGLDMAIMLDGGHIASVNNDNTSINGKQKQHNIIQFIIEEKDVDNMAVNVKGYSIKKHGNVSLSTNFKVREFKCNDGSDIVFIAPELVNVLQKIRTHFGKPVTINSAYRTPTYNKTVGGENDSQHQYGIACDIVVKGISPKTVAAYAETLLKNKGGIGIYSNFTHIDVRETKARWNG